ncbi:bifunctional 4-hydroxy-2-oxoglutarate aldolase/2-dehydro-3-deoxy-phosphogluconate aldolase [Bacillota bacterium Meth-B3]|nr:bifunctional 4-hydroxy-2-oxoglutarate aldolase/2-dehydro-3-deoxy-phosphogluconate aldolase [Christensenellaceae bacterium]MEA5066795.1 bifunctional 4-hydroxy-2-oxoglutarate aldolase/2-dehydro-3-deoxy-phosphogluconate aldolase [Eubacteriales bacterium]
MVSMERVASCGIVPVVVLDSVDQAIPTAKALLEGGINVMEITFRTAAAKASIATVAREVKEMTVGAGTVIDKRQLGEAADAGAQFIVSPGSDRALIQDAQTRGLPIVPGAVTPSEIMVGLSLGLTVFKFFPAEVFGGISAIKALSGPFPQIRFVPTGGIGQANAADYFRNQKIMAVGGSWMVTAEMIREGKFDQIAELSAKATALFREIRGGS